MTDNSELAALYQGYFDAFNARDVDRLAGLFAFPLVIGGGGREPRTVPDAQTYRQYMLDILDMVTGQGWSHSVLERFHTVAMAGDTGIVTAHYRRCRADESEIERGTANYLLRKLDGAWKIVGMITP